MGQKQKSGGGVSMSALGGEADVIGVKADMPCLALRHRASIDATRRQGVECPNETHHRHRLPMSAAGTTGMGWV